MAVESQRNYCQGLWHFQWTGDGRKPKRKKKVARKQTKKMAIRDSSSDSSDGEDMDTTGKLSEPEEGNTVVILNN